MESSERDGHTPDDPPDAEQPTGAEDPEEQPAVEDEVDEASDQSFPASDPPSY
jgi:hypothetical protein